MCVTYAVTGNDMTLLLIHPVGHLPLPAQIVHYTIDLCHEYVHILLSGSNQLLSDYDETCVTYQVVGGGVLVVIARHLV